MPRVVAMIAGCSRMNLETILERKVLGENCGSGARCDPWSQLSPFCIVLDVVVQRDFFFSEECRLQQVSHSQSFCSLGEMSSSGDV